MRGNGTIKQAQHLAVALVIGQTPSSLWGYDLHESKDTFELRAVYQTELYRIIDRKFLDHGLDIDVNPYRDALIRSVKFG